jgi:hypothetical protein
LTFTTFVKTRAQNKTRTFTAALTGFEEPPALATNPTGDFTATLSEDGNSLDFVMNYDGFETNVLASHIHLGLPSVSGGVTVFLCGGGDRPDCPQGGGTVSGTITAENVGGIAAQRLQAGDFGKLLEAMEAGATYVNVHSQALPGGEIRGQIKAQQSASK